jgi:hypothetical protein
MKLTGEMDTNGGPAFKNNFERGAGGGYSTRRPEGHLPLKSEVGAAFKII